MSKQNKASNYEVETEQKSYEIANHIIITLSNVSEAARYFKCSANKITDAIDKVKENNNTLYKQVEAARNLRKLIG